MVNTIVAMWMSKSVRAAGPLFYAGLILVIVGAVAVLVFSPVARPTAAQAAPEFSFFDWLKVMGFVALTAICWGCYGPLLHKGQTAMQGSRMRPFICVGLAYVVIAVALPELLRLTVGDKGFLTWSGSLWSLAGGVAGALGSLGVILAFTFRWQADLRDAAGVRRSAGREHVHQHSHGEGAIGDFATFLRRADRGRRRGR